MVWHEMIWRIWYGIVYGIVWCGTASVDLITLFCKVGIGGESDLTLFCKVGIGGDAGLSVSSTFFCNVGMGGELDLTAFWTLGTGGDSERSAFWQKKKMNSTEL